MSSRLRIVQNRSGAVRFGVDYPAESDFDDARLVHFTQPARAVVPVRGSETVLEATYQCQVAPWWQLQGDMQYTFDAGAGQNPNDPKQGLRNTFVIGVRTNVTF